MGRKKKKYEHELQGGFLMLYHKILNHREFQKLSCYSQMIFIRALQKRGLASSKHEKTFTLTPGDCKNMGVATFRRHMKTLINLDWIVIVQNGGLYRNANKYEIPSLKKIFGNMYSKPWGGIVGDKE